MLTEIVERTKLLTVDKEAEGRGSSVESCMLRFDAPDVDFLP